MQSSDKSGFAWRKWNRLLHRDIGYLAAGLTILYAVSGLAVNHIDDWNPNHYREISTGLVPASALPSGLPDDAWIRQFVSSAGFSAEYKNHFFASPVELQVFLQETTVTLNLQTGEWTSEKEAPRFLLHFFNFLHLNNAKKIWTLIADVFAVALIFLAISGLFMIKGPKGITGRGVWLTTAGIILPVLIGWLIYR